MSSSWCFLVAASLALAAPAPVATAAPPPGFIDRVLANGLEVTIAADSTLPIVATRVWYHVGAANETKNTRGFAHLFEHLMFSGTPAHPKGVWEAHHHRFGGVENAHTSWDETTYESDIPPAGFHEVLVMEADRMVNLKLDAEALENEKKIVTEELRATIENDPYDRMLTAALKALCGDHPYAVTPLGTKEEIAAATLDQARAFYTRYYRPKNAHLVIVGTRRWLGDARRGRAAVRPAAHRRRNASRGAVALGLEVSGAHPAQGGPAARRGRGTGVPDATAGLG
jgi:zinc protease